MVRWYSPLLLIRIALRTFVATVIGKIVDNREIQAALSPIKDDDLLHGAYDLSKEKKNSYWIDYVADIGDGWDSTYAVANLLAKKELIIDGISKPLPKGELLVMGGDEVYPDPSMKAYTERTLAPYSLACENHKKDDDGLKSHLFAIPGNHDWYDGLQAFNNIFCQARGYSNSAESFKIAGWKTSQKRSYFSIKLPHRWWLCGVDIQLGTGANTTQIDYFREIAETQMKAGDRIILCCPTPEWLHAEVGETGMMQSFTEIMPVLSHTGAKVRLVLAGDVHHYSRYHSKANGMQFVTAGGGGAFMHPTHKLPQQLGAKSKNKKRPQLNLETHYPSKKESYSLSHKLFLFPFTNWDFALAIGAVYTLLAWIFEARTLAIGESMSSIFMKWLSGNISTIDGLLSFFTAIPKSPAFALIVFGIYVGFIKFNFTKRKIISFGLGMAHAMAHFAPFILAYFIASYTASQIREDQILNNIDSFLTFIAIIFVLGSLLGGFVYGVYLWVALNVFGLQWTNAFSALRICNYRNFIRIHMNSKGELIIYPLKVDDISQKPHKVELIEQPFTIK